MAIRNFHPLLANQTTLVGNREVDFWGVLSTASATDGELNARHDASHLWFYSEAWLVQCVEIDRRNTMRRADGDQYCQYCHRPTAQCTVDRPCAGLVAAWAADAAHEAHCDGEAGRATDRNYYQ